MGNFFHAAHLHTADAVAARTALAAAVEELGFRCWLAPHEDGWLTFFPTTSTPVSAIGRAITRRTKSHLLFTVVHDSDVFCYALYRDGEEIDDFASDPDYFDDAPSAVRAQARGNPAVIAPLLAPPHTAAELAAWYARTADAEPETLMTEFMVLLGIRRGLTSYDYLERGERDTVGRWADFIHLPDLAAEKAAAKQEEEQIREAKRKLLDRGVLVFDSTLWRGRAAWQKLQLHGAHPAGGFVVSWYQDDPQPRHWLPPHDPVPLSFGAHRVPRYFSQLISAESRLIVETDSGAALLNVADGSLLGCRGPSQSWPVAFVEPGRTLVFATREELVGYAVDDARELFRVHTGYPAQRVRQHPKQAHLLWFGQRDLGIIDLRTGERLARCDLFNRRTASKKAAQWRAQGIEPDARFDLEREDFLSLEFTPNGEMLIAGTSEGLRLYRYADVLATGPRMPEPAFVHETSQQLQDYRWVHGLAVDPERGAVYFTQGNDSLQRLDLATRTTQEVMPSLDRARLASLTRSGPLLAGLRRGYRDLPRREDEFSFQVWNTDVFAAIPPPLPAPPAS